MGRVTNPSLLVAMRCWGVSRQRYWGGYKPFPTCGNEMGERL
ncbi:hypothetical protein [uncultured Gammaproteobacteria bacterium]|nr:hypothetical protein [uncultured Gammaproteobacteria bacterium]CAC9967794.1 hypothetical protein [uncultured Gammaproteobacteria bacterium]